MRFTFTFYAKGIPLGHLKFCILYLKTLKKLMQKMPNARHHHRQIMSVAIIN